MRVRDAVVVLAVAIPVAFGGFRAVAQDATPAAVPEADGGPTTMTLVERAENVTRVDLGATGASTGDLIVWGPNPLYDAANTQDTGATTQGSCIAFNAAGDCVLNETILFPDGSTLEIQGIQPGAVVTSTRTIVGGSGRYRGTTGTVTVEPTADLATWTKTFELWS